MEKRSNTPVFIGIGVVVVVGLVLAVSVMMTEERELPKGPEISQEPELSAEERGLIRAEKTWGKLSKYLAANPGDLDDQQMRLSAFIQGNAKYGKTFTDKAQARLDEIEAEQRSQVNLWFEQLQADVKRFADAGEFAAAESLFDEIPDFFERHKTNAQAEAYVALRKQARMDKIAGSSLDDLGAKANRYLKEGKGDIALAILEEFPTKYEDDAPDVWSAYDRVRKRLEAGELLAVQAGERRSAEESARLRKEKRLAEMRVRKQRWADAKANIKPANQLGQYDTYNWILSTDEAWPVASGQVPPSWKHRAQDGVGILSIDNQSGSSLHNGFFTNHWKDYTLEFDLRLHKGKIQLSPRSTTSSGRAMLRPVETSDWIDIEDSDVTTGEWVSVSMEVFQDEVTIKYGSTTKTFKKGEGGFDMFDTGGVVFQAPNGSNWDIRNVRTRLVTHSREKLY